MKKGGKKTSNTKRTRKKCASETANEEDGTKKKIIKKNRDVSEEEPSLTPDNPKKKGTTRRPTQKGLPADVEKCVENFMTYATENSLDRLKDEFRMVNDITPLPGTYERFTMFTEKNRYPEIPCLDKTRVSMVPAGEKATLEDYIHANKVVVENAEREYVAAQAPKATTIEDFYKIVFETSAQCIVVLTPFTENNQNKCEEFWPMESGKFNTYGKMWVNNKKVEVQDQYTVYTMEILPEGCSNSWVTKIAHTTCWLDKCAAQSGRTVLRMIKWMKTLENGPAIIVSSAGVGRAGTFIAIDAVLSRLFKGHDSKVYELVQSIRNQRALAVSNELQYLFIYSTILDYIRAKISKYDQQVKKFFESIKAL